MITQRCLCFAQPFQRCFHKEVVAVTRARGYMAGVMEPLVAIVIQHAHFHSTKCPGTLGLNLPSSISQSWTVPTARLSVAGSCISMSSAIGVTHSSGFSCTVRSCVVGRKHRCSFLQYCSSHIAHSPVWVRTCVPEPPSHSVRVGVVYGSP